MTPSRAAAVVVSLLLIHTGLAAHATAPAAGGVRLLQSMETALVTVVGTVSERSRLDDRAWRARLRLENILVAPLLLAVAAAEAETLDIVWEERSPSRPPRFAQGDRILVVLEALPGDSIWLSRISEPSARLRILQVAQRGEAFLRRPRLGTLTILEHLLALAREDRRDAPGVVHLADLARTAAPPLAQDAMAALAVIARLDEMLDPTTSAWLVEALVRRDASEAMQRVMLDLIGDLELNALRPALEARVASAAARAYANGASAANGANGADGPKGASASSELADPLVYAALARLEGKLDGATVQLLAQEPDAEHRLAAIHAARDASDRSMLTGLARYDRDARVRAAAVERLVQLEGASGIPVALDALRDDDAGVRQSAAGSLARIGAPAVADLRRVVDDDSQPASIAAVQALRKIRPEGVAVLQEIAESHPDESIRALSRLALGLEINPEH